MCFVRRNKVILKFKDIIMTVSKILSSTLAVSALALAAPATAKIATGSNVADMTVTDSNGVQHNLSDFAGQKVVLTLVYQGAIDDNRSANPATVAGATNYVLAAMDDLKAGNAVAVSDTAPYGCSVKYKS